MNAAALTFQSSNAADTTLTAINKAASYTVGGQELRETNVSFIEWSQKLVRPIYISTLAYLSCIITLYIISFVVILSVLLTNKRSCKNIAHVGWISGAISLLLGVIQGTAYAFSSLIIYDYCGVLDSSTESASIDGLTTLYPQDLAPVLDACMF